MGDFTKVFPCISLTRTDLEALDDPNEPPKFAKIAEKLTDEQMQSMAEYIGEWLYDCDQWEQAMEAALEREQVK